MQAETITLRNRPDGALKDSDFVPARQTLPPRIGDQVLVQVLHLSIDPYQRGALDMAPFVGPSLPIGGVIPGRGIGRVLDGMGGGFGPGDLVSGDFGWRSHVLCPAAELRPVDPGPHPLSWQLGVLGVPGITARLALDRIGAPAAGETVLVSSAAGAVGSTAAQLARAAGCRVIGIAGGPAKCRMLTGELGLDAAIDRHANGADAAAVSPDAPQGIDVLFDNVGGTFLDQMLPLMNPLGRVVICGFMSGYNITGAPPAMRNQMLISTRRLRMEGFSVRDHVPAHPTARADLRRLADAGQLRQIETTFAGLSQAPSALIALLAGKATGKVTVQLAA